MKVTVVAQKPTAVVSTSSNKVLNVSAVTDSPIIAEIATKATKQYVQVTPSGPKGDDGEQGEQGIQGPAGKDGDLRYEHNQMTPSADWIIDHMMGVMPHVIVVDSAGDTVWGDVRYVSPNRITITFGGAFAGMAYLN
jgi:hypothetical protein